MGNELTGHKHSSRHELQQHTYIYSHPRIAPVVARCGQNLSLSLTNASWLPSFSAKQNIIYC